MQRERERVVINIITIITREHKLEESEHPERCSEEKRRDPKLQRPSTKQRGCRGLKPFPSSNRSKPSSLFPLRPTPNSPFLSILSIPNTPNKKMVGGSRVGGLGKGKI